MNPPQLRETTMNPDTRRLVQLTYHDAADAEVLLDMLLADKRAADRRAWIETNGDHADNLDAFQRRGGVVGIAVRRLDASRKHTTIPPKHKSDERYISAS